MKIKAKRKWYSSAHSWILVVLFILCIFFNINVRQGANKIFYEQYPADSTSIPKLNYLLKNLHNRRDNSLSGAVFKKVSTFWLENTLDFFALCPSDSLFRYYINFVDIIIKHIDESLREAIKEDKGTGCEVPQLDPFAKEVMKYVKKLPEIVCNKKEWVKCYLSECRVVKEVLNTTKNIQCAYRDILHLSDRNYTIGPETLVEGDGVYTLNASDHVRIICKGESSTDRSIIKKWSGMSLGFRDTYKLPKPASGRENTLNVLILGFDSTARNSFIRQTPMSYKVLTEELGATIMEGYNILGDGTPASLFPILSGKNELEFPDARKKMGSTTFLDVKEFIFHKLRKDGYRTAYFEDTPGVGTFQYRLNGFRRQPADHYLRSFYLETQKDDWAYKYCIGDTLQYKLMLNITDQFFKMSGKKFCFTFIADISHSDENRLAMGDEGVAEFLRSFKTQGRLRNTLLMVLGDHGPRFATARNTLQGQLEERLPLLAVVLPEELKLARPEAARALQHNAHVLTTPHDVHATVLDALGLPQHSNPYIVPGADLKRGLSFLEPIQSNRSCSEAGVEKHWCACLKWYNISETDNLYKRSAEALITYINSLTESMRSKCAPRTLISISWVMQQINNKEMRLFKGSADNDGYIALLKGKHLSLNYRQLNLMVKITVGPGTGVYEATMTYMKSDDVFIINARDISRTSAYGTEPSCISSTHPHLDKFCYCSSSL